MSRTLQPEDQISHYRVVGPLGAGGMGEVYIARDSKLERSVALKVLPPRLVRNEERVRRFITEAKSASSLNHPNIVTIYEIGHDEVRASQAGDDAEPDTEPVHFISMELVSGETLTQKIHTERADLRTLVGYLAQAAEGIAKAHAAGIVHRDLKPANIMISKDGFAKVLDFGLAKLTEKQAAADEEMTSAPTEGAATGDGVIMGTVGYMSPEQVQAKGVDHRSDIFSMGCILYEAAARKRPFVADTDVEVMHQILREKPRAVEEVNPETPAEIRRIIRRCLHKSADQRFQSMKDLAIELREAVEEWENLSTTGTSAGSGVSVASGALKVPPGKSTPLWLVIGAAAVLGVGGLAFGIYSYFNGTAESASVAAPAGPIEMSVLMSRDDLGEATLSADGRYLAFVAFADGKTSLNVRQVRTGSDVEILPAQNWAFRGVSFSPDGDYLYYINRDPESPNYSALFQVPSLGGTPRKIAFDVDTAATFSPDGKQICFRRGIPDMKADSLQIIDLESGEERELIRISDPESFEAAPAWSPDGERIAIGMLSGEGGLHAWVSMVDVKTGEATDMEPVEVWFNIPSLGWASSGDALVLSVAIPAPQGPQIYRMEWPGGRTVRLTSDLDGYTGLSLSGDGESLAAVRRSDIDNAWVVPAEPGADAMPVTNASSSAASVNSIRALPGGAILFAQNQGGRFLLHRVESDGSGKRALITEGLFNYNPKYAEGAGLLFNRVDDDKKLLSHIWRMDLDGGNLRRLTSGDGANFQDLASDGRTILMRKPDNPQMLWAMPLDGGDPYELADRAGFSFFSPDGRRVLHTRLEEVEAGRHLSVYYVIPVEGGDPLVRFLLPPGALGPQWDPGSDSLTYIDRGAGWNVFRHPLGEGTPIQMTFFDEGRIRDAEWSPDGSKLLLHRRVGGRDSLWVLDRGATEPVEITEFRTGRIRDHHWSLDGRHIIFGHGTTSLDVVMISGF